MKQSRRKHRESDSSRNDVNESRSNHRESGSPKVTNQSGREHRELSDPESQSRGEQKKDWKGPEGSTKSPAERQSNREH